MENQEKSNEIGFLNINKPPDCTSHDVVIMLRKSLGIKKIGHSGTLDPFATGVLVIGINDATRLFEYLPSDKVYIAEITFGIGTDTDDITGNVLVRSDIIPTLDEIKEKLQFFSGQIKQKPPIYSAVKINGNRSYNLARKNQISANDVKEKDVEIYSIEIVSPDIGVCGRKPLRTLKIHCSGGTYIRSIARDLGEKLGTCAVLSSLKRIKIGKCFSIEESIDINSINKSNFIDHLISPLSAVMLPKVCLDNQSKIDIFHGKSVHVDQNICPAVGSDIQLLDNNNDLIAIGQVASNCIIKPEKVFVK